jgi:hypothetical protein
VEFDQDVINTIIAEALGDGDAGMAAVAHVIANRAKKLGISEADVVRQKSQFEGYSNPGSSVKKSQSDPAVVARVQRILAGVRDGTIPDPTDGGTQFHASSMTPSWATAENKHGTVKIGGQTFYKGKGATPASTGNSALDAIATATAPILPTRRPESVTAYAPAPAPLNPSNPLERPTTSLLPATKVKTVPVNPTNGRPVNFPALRSAAIQRDVGAVGRTPVIPAPAAKKPAAPAAPARAIVPALNKTTQQIGQEADNARMSGYRDILEMGPSSKGAKPTGPTPSTKPTTSVLPKSSGAVKTTAPAQQPIPKGVVPVAAQTGMAQAKIAAKPPVLLASITGLPGLPKPKPAPVVANGYDAGKVKVKTDRLPKGEELSLPPEPVQTSVIPRGGVVPMPRRDPRRTPVLPDKPAIPMAPSVSRRLAGAEATRAIPYLSAVPFRNRDPGPSVNPQNVISSLLSMFTGGNTGSTAKPSYTTTEFQQNNFQTTTGAQMPGSTNNDRWTSGYSTAPAPSTSKPTAMDRW